MTLLSVHIENHTNGKSTITIRMWEDGRAQKIEVLVPTDTIKIEDTPAEIHEAELAVDLREIESRWHDRIRRWAWRRD